MAGIQKEIPLVARNLRILREFHGEQQKDLKDLYGCASESSISMYEKGQRGVPPECLQALANHYGVTVQVLNDVELTSEMLSRLQATVDWREMQKVHKMIFPRFISPKARENADFQRGEDYYMRIMSSPAPMASMAEKCKLSYYQAFKTAKLFSAAANTMMATILEFIILGMDASVFRELNDDCLRNNYFLKLDEKMAKKLSDKESAFWDDNYEMFYECAKHLRTNVKHAEAADYYIALKCFRSSLIELDAKTKQIFGVALMSELASIENQYATRFMEWYLEDENEEQ
ncbi:MAG: helix-turn-helix transcriptional regulator [Ruminococcaceae bacterium]|nr:helix-turn-helix transcriptional regulator [Oscillospiraceae bacterium]